MQRRSLYLALTIVGIVIPMIPFVSWLAQHGLDAPFFVAELFANPVSTFFALDLLLTALVVIYLAWRARRGVALWWLAVAATLLLGVSAGLPLLLYLEERPKSLVSA